MSLQRILSRQARSSIVRFDPKGVRGAKSSRYFQSYRTPTSKEKESFRRSSSPPLTRKSTLRRAVAQASHSATHATLAQTASKFASRNFVLLGLLSAILVGWFFPGPGVAVQASNLSQVATIGIFIVSGLLVDQGEAWAAIRSVAGLMYGLIAILLVSPILGIFILQSSFLMKEMAIGLAVFCCMPTSLSMAITLTQQAGGNSAMALLLTIASNILGVVTVPLMVSSTLGGVTAHFDVFKLFINLIKTVLLPLLFGICLQLFFRPKFQDWRRLNRQKLSYISAFLICLVPWTQVSQASSARLPLGPGDFISCLVAGALVHCLLLLVNLNVTKLIQFNKDKKESEDIRQAVVLCSSQKTLPVAIATLAQLGPVLGPAAGIAAIPCVLTHLLQSIIDSALVAHWIKARNFN